jgi:predicted CoA-binding protein
LPEVIKHRVPVEEFAAVGLFDPAPQLGPQLLQGRFPLLEQSQAFADDFTRGLIPARGDARLDELFQPLPACLSSRKIFSRALFREFRARGYDMVPVNPVAKEIEGQRCFAGVQEIQPPVDGVLASPKVTETVVRDCAEVGIKRVWMYRAAGSGAVSREAVQFCTANGVSAIPGECPFMLFPGTAWGHRFHGWVKKIAGAYPRSLRPPRGPARTGPPG